MKMMMIIIMIMIPCQDPQGHDRDVVSHVAEDGDAAEANVFSEILHLKHDTDCYTMMIMVYADEFTEM